MKKIISFLLAVTVIASFGLVSFAAANATVGFKNVTVDAKDAEQEVVINMVMDFTEETHLCSMAFKIVADEGVTLKAIDDSALKAIIPISGMTSAPDFYFTYADDNMEIMDYTFPAGKIVLPLTVVVPAGTGKYTIGFDQTGKSDALDPDFNSAGIPWNSGEITVQAAAPADKELASTAKGTVQGSEVEGKPTDWQVGQGLYATITAPATDFTYKWAITLNGERRYSKAPFAVNGVTESSPVVLAATFINGGHTGDHGAQLSVADVDVIAKAGEEFYLTNSADSANKNAK